MLVVVAPDKHEHANHVKRVSPAEFFEHERADYATEERAQMLTGRDEAEGEGLLAVHDLLGDKTARAWIVEALEAAGEAATDGDVRKNVVLVSAERTHVGKQEGGGAP